MNSPLDMPSSKFVVLAGVDKNVGFMSGQHFFVALDVGFFHMRLRVVDKVEEAGVMLQSAYP
jgi:hypothetical protein